MKNGIYHYDISVSILANSISSVSFSALSGHQHLGQDSLFVLSEEDIKIIEIIKSEYNLSDKTGQFYIVEQENEYEIIHSNDFFDRIK